MSDLGNKKIMAKNIRHYMNKFDVTQTEVCNALGIKMPTFSDWVNAKTYPRIDKIELMANYFGISKADLVEDHNTYNDDHYYLNDETREIAQEIFEKPGLRSLFKAARNLPPDRLKAHIDFIENLKALEEHKNDEGC